MAHHQNNFTITSCSLDIFLQTTPPNRTEPYSTFLTMGLNYAQLHTPDGSKSEMDSDTSRTNHNRRFNSHTVSPHQIAREIDRRNSDGTMEDLEDGASNSKDRTVVVYEKDDKLGCGGRLGKCPIVTLIAFVLCGILIGIGVSQLLICQRSDTDTWCRL